MIKVKIIELFLLSVLIEISASLVASKTQTKCEYYDRNRCINENKCDVEEVPCPNESEKANPSCYVVWYIDENGAPGNVSMKGCFTDNPECNQTECIARISNANNLRYCCCKGSFCNRNFTYIPTPTTPPTPKKPVTDNNILYILIAFLTLIALVIVFCFGVCLYRRKKQGAFNEIPTVEPEVTNSSPSLAPRSIHLLEMKARGRFGSVWQGRLKNQDVAVKVFFSQERDSWSTELEIFKLPRMRHPNILEFIAAEKHLDKIPQEYWLITSYHSYGSLCDYLKAHVITWFELCKIAETMARGLMHLHEEIPSPNSDNYKPAVAHRDFKSKNVLLKSDLSACIADFGLAMVFQPGQPCGDTHGQVGTRRYMAPEVLEGAINFTRDAFLRIDVYACGLVLWEMVSRCNVHNGLVSEYTLPFETELGLHPTLNEMQENVVMKKLRPRISEIWRTHPGLSAICDTMEECWDHDAEARLSSSCVMERISQYTRYPTTPLLIETNTDTTFRDS